MEPKHSSCSEKPIIGLYHEPVESSPEPQPLFPHICLHLSSDQVLR